MLETRVPLAMRSHLLEHTTAQVLSPYKDDCFGDDCSDLPYPCLTSMEKNSRETFIAPESRKLCHLGRSRSPQAIMTTAVI